MIDKKYVIYGAVALISLAGAGMYFKSNVFAETTAKYPPVVQMLVDKFKLNTSEVDKVMDTAKKERATRRQEMQEKRLEELETKSEKAVNDGKITAAEKASLISKIKEMHSIVGEGPKDASVMEKVKALRDEIRALEKKAGIEPMGPKGFGGRGEGCGCGRDAEV